MNLTETAADLMRLIGVTKVSLSDLATRGVVIERGDKRGYYRLSATSRQVGAEKTPAQLAHGSDRRKQPWRKPRRNSYPACPGLGQ